MISPLLIPISIVYYSKLVITYNNSMNPPITLAWLYTYKFLYYEQTTHDAVRHQPTTTAKKEKKLPKY